MPRSLSLRLRVAAFGACLALLGCTMQEDVSHYKVPKPPPKPLNRILGAIVSLGDKPDDGAWFFKLVGPAEVAEKHQPEFEKFIDSVRVKDDKSDPTWTLPDGWEKEPNRSSMTFATFRLGPNGAVELTVLRSGGELLQNINRWRGQLDAPALAADELDKVIEKRTIGSRSVVFVNMTGTGSGKTKVPPFMGGGANP